MAKRPQDIADHWTTTENVAAILFIVLSLLLGSLPDTKLNITGQTPSNDTIITPKPDDMIATKLHDLELQLKNLNETVLKQQHKISLMYGKENVRAFASLNQMAKYCPEGSLPIHTPISFVGKTGSEICQRDGREDNQKNNRHTVCKAVRWVVIRNDNSVWGHYAKLDLDCNTPVENPWPWGTSYQTSDTYGWEWHHPALQVVCCAKS